MCRLQGHLGGWDVAVLRQPLSVMSGHRQSWRRLGGVHMDKSVCVQMCATTCWGKSASWKCMGVLWLCRWVLDITTSPGKICGSGGVGMGYDRAQPFGKVVEARTISSVVQHPAQTCLAPHTCTRP